MPASAQGTTGGGFHVHEYAPVCPQQARESRVANDMRSIILSRTIWMKSLSPCRCFLRLEKVEIARVHHRFAKLTGEESQSTRPGRTSLVFPRVKSSRRSPLVAEIMK
jgi:hypothetical protein